ncbi:MAG: four helix bundle protein [Chloroflexi bacterium]|nr:four helix bundle protein [Chloroflexota bacterium]
MTSETEYPLIPARDLEFLSKETHEKLHNDVEEVKRMLAFLLKTIRANC